ncbi:hypothetical protein DMH01_03250 [Amycolatopsis sp. WAC 04182]|uniref:hypothetical protein n=1 Tax=Amycolatopsis sp. WAC 04182 TaxID=2203198 RepID=UPI000F7A7A37|nr:hypothetical protein [Amycolatopsis sp. WAC 04182]RSN65407.1 hypothetical protein DMH01_03250 [Amycolatopsis sp. WAC 04182]
MTGQHGDPIGEAPSMLARYAKAFAAFLGTLTPQAVFAVLDSNGVHVNAWINLAVTVILGVAATAAAPKNEE